MIWNLLFLFLVGALLPFLAWSSYRHLGRSRPELADLPSPNALALQSIVILALVFAAALACAKSGALAISWIAPLSPTPVLAAIAALAVALGLARLEARKPLGEDDVLRKQMRAVGITKLGLLVMIMAAIAEEFAYRGVLYALLASALPPLVAAVLSAALFGLAHFSQGIKGALTSAVFALALQLLCYLSGALFLAMLVHFLYDIAVTWLGKRLSDQRELA